MNLPPDPDNQNDERAEWAEATIQAFVRITGTDREDALADLLANLMHWCDRQGFDFDAELARGHGMYQEETQA
jgi:hypothetical protein